MDALLLLKASLLWSLSLLAARLLSRTPAVVRHRLWTAAFAGLLALPLLAYALPGIDVPVPAGWQSAPPQTGRFDGPATLDGPNVASPPAAGAASAPSIADGTRMSQIRPTARPAGLPFLVRGFDRRTGLVLLLAVWSMGVTVAAGALLLSLLRVRRLTRTAHEIVDPAWRDAAHALGTRLGLRRPARLLASPLVATPMAAGVWRPVIFLPATSDAWSAERRDVVLAHEIAHLASGDPLRHVAARLAVAFYWFHPLAWLAARRSAVAREQACDESVLALGTRPSVYARVLLDLAESLQPGAPALGALPMVERSLLETRLMSILTDPTRPAPGRWGLIPTFGVAMLTLVIAAAQPAIRAAAALGAAPAARTSDRAAPAIAERGRAHATITPSAAWGVGAPPKPFAQGETYRDSDCWSDTPDGSSFKGTLSASSNGRSVIYEQVGTRGADKVIQKSFGDLRLCLVAEDAGGRDNAERPSQWPGRARRVVMESRRGSVVQRLEIERQAAGGQRTSWRVGGAERPFDAAAQAWRDRMLTALDTTWELATLRGEVSSLRGQISSIRGQQSSLRGEISSLRGEVSSMRGRASSVRGEESSLRGQISSIQGHVSSMRGSISSERGAISSLDATRNGADAADSARITARVGQHEAAIARVEQAIRDYDAGAKVAAVEREIAALDADGKVAAIEKEIQAFDLDGKVAAVEGRITALDVDGKVAAIERQITTLDADRRGQQLEERREGELKQLEAAIAAIR